MAKSGFSRKPRLRAEPGFSGLLQQLPAPDVAVSRGRLRRPDADGADPFRSPFQKVRDIRQHRNQIVRPFDDVIGRQQDHDCIFPAARFYDSGRQGGAGGRVAGRRFSDDVFSGERRQQHADRIHIFAVREDQDMFRRQQRLQPFHRLLDHGAFTEKLQELLRAAAPALRPEAFSPAARHDDGIDMMQHNELSLPLRNKAPPGAGGR